ncbi:MAG: hypothetical protein GTO18_19430 [Anaerolineales bacterium]|nr:hypothetical protein [Anaerolineales bacterium]
MTDPIHLEIAGVFISTTPSNVTITELDPIYQPFRKEENGSSKKADINIELEVGKLPPTSQLPKMLESDQSWSMFRDGDDYVLTSAPSPPSFEQRWQARFNPECTRVTVYCNDAYVEEVKGSATIMNPVQYPLDQLLMMYHMAQRDGALVHAAGIKLHGKGLIFPGRSGAGKSTLSRQFPEGSDDLLLLSDDRVMVRKVDDGYTVFGTPWPGEAGIARNESSSLAGILFISHAPANEIHEIDPKDALAWLLPVVSIPWFDAEVMPKLLEFCEALVTNIPTYELQFQPSVEVARIIEEYFSL